MLPDIADMGGEDDVAARALRVIGDVAHLGEEQFDSVDRIARRFLMGVVEIVLGVGDHRDSEFAAFGLRGSGRQCDGGGEQADKPECTEHRHFPFCAARISAVTSAACSGESTPGSSCGIDSLTLE
jgi:hypothetical protein